MPGERVGGGGIGLPDAERGGPGGGGMGLPVDDTGPGGGLDGAFFGDGVVSAGGAASAAEAVSAGGAGVGFGAAGGGFVAVGGGATGPSTTGRLVVFDDTMPLGRS